MVSLKDKSLEIFIYVCLAQQLEAYSFAFTGLLQYEGKYRLKRFQHEAKELMAILSKSVNEDDLAEDAKVFDDALRLIREAKGEQKLQLYKLLIGWTRGEVKVIDEPTEAYMSQVEHDYQMNKAIDEEAIMNRDL